MYSFSKTLILICLMFVSACSSTAMIKLNKCPEISIISDGYKVNKLDENTGEALYKAIITKPFAECHLTEYQELEIEGTFQLHISLDKKTANNIPIYYFISVLDDNNKIILKSNYVENVNIENESSYKFEVLNFKEKIRVNNLDVLGKYKVLLSFQLTKEELLNNRKSINPYE